MSQPFCILITGSPTNSQAHLSALRFSHALVEQNHKIFSIFFYQEAVHIANQFIHKPSDEAQLSQEWANLANQNQIELQVCVSACERRGIIQQQTNEQNLHPAFSIVGLSQLAVAMNSSNIKLVHFK